MQIVSRFLESEDLFQIKKDELNELFFRNYSEIYKIAFDLNLDVEKFREFSQSLKRQATDEELGNFLVETLENDTTYILLCYYLYRFITACLDIAKKETLDKVEEIINFAGVGEKQIKIIADEYKELLASQKTRS